MTETDRIREFIQRHLIVFDEGISFSDEDNILALGLVDSLFAVQLVLFVEEEFNIEVLDSELNIDNFSSVNTIGALIRRKKV
jgi:acyl carrier protein